MRVITFNQLQLRLLTFLLILFTTSVFSYRYFIELPKLEESILRLTERELETLKFSIESKLDGLSKISFDHAVWTSSYDFINNPTQEFIDENIVDNTFESLEIDGIFYFNGKNQLILNSGFHRKSSKSINFTFHDFSKHPSNLNIFPTPITATGAPKKAGFINTSHGPAIFATTQIRDSNMNGDYRGYVVMVQLLEDKFVSDLSKNTLTTISYTPEVSEQALEAIPKLKDSLYNVKITPYSDVRLNDESGALVAAIRIQHSTGESPELFDAQSSIFTLLMSFAIYLVYCLVSIVIIKPVKRLATDIKARDNPKLYSPLEDNYKVAELIAVSENVNKLMAMVQEQNEFLSKQANTDQLTKVLNRRGLMTAMEIQKELCIRNNIGFVVVMVDIDYFKRYNDSIGHLEGDIALVEVANVLNSHCLRESDICARYGGEEFVMLFHNIEGGALQQKLTDIIASMKTLNLSHPDSPIAEHLTVSLGVAVITPKSAINYTLSLNDVLRIADSALYEAKESGRNCFKIKYLENNLNKCS